MIAEATLPAEPLLRTLAPALRQLHEGVRVWLDAPHRFPIPTLARASLEGLARDLQRSAEILDVDRPNLVIMLMGGTGVGKSTLLNALAGGSIAQASFKRPTTRDPVVYHHYTIKPDKLDPALRACRLISHDRPELEHKILVDTPDLDSNDLTNRDKLLQVLPVADVVLYVGSQEKYHDELGWQLFLQQRRRRAFAFVLNKWDRCLHGGGGLRPDEDLLRDLRQQGFETPLLFRTCAQLHLDRGTGNGQTIELPPGEQFQELVSWLEQGLSRLEIEAIMARGVSQLLRHLEATLTSAAPPDLTAIAGQTRAAWQRVLDDEADAEAAVLVQTLEPYQKEIEHFFALEGQQRFYFLMGGYLQLANRLRYMGSSLRGRISILPRLGGQPATVPTLDLESLINTCSSTAAERHLDARFRALTNRLLVAADQQGYPLNLLNEPTEAVIREDWRHRNAQNLREVLKRIHATWTAPSGIQRLFHGLVFRIANWGPGIVLLALAGRLLWRYADPMGAGHQVQWLDLFMLLLFLLIVLVGLHLLILFALPFRWPTIRGQFQRLLDGRLQHDLHTAYLPIPEKMAQVLREERQEVERLAAETSTVLEWLVQREQSASIKGLYGSQEIG